MAKAKLKKDKLPSKDSSKETIKKTKKQKKKQFWQNHPKIAAKKTDSKTVSPVLPPKAPQDFSSNWKALKELLKQDEKKPVETTTGTTFPKKDLKVTEKKSEEPVPPKCNRKINGDVKTVKAEFKEAKANSKALPMQAREKEAITNVKKRKKMFDRMDARQEKKPEKQIQAEPPKVDIWFDDVDPDDIEAAMGPEAGRVARQMQGIPDNKATTVDRVLVKERAFEGLTRTVAMDCEMVGVGLDGEESILARVSIVNQFGKCVYDKFVKPMEKVTDYRTAVSGIRPKDIKNGELFKVVQQEVSEILKGRILVGHAIHNDLKILFLDHPKKATRDTQKYKPFKKKVKSGRPSLKLLCEQILNVKVQTGEHSSVQDAQAAMRLYMLEKKLWEGMLKEKHKHGGKNAQKDKQSLPQ